MKSVTFKEWTLTELEDSFALNKKWETNNEQVSDIEKQILLQLQKSLKRGGRFWNEVELENKFISPLIMLSNIDDEKIGYFLERPLSGIVGDYELSGIVAGMIATGIREPHTPYFCFHEYKCSVENQEMLDGQVLAAMLVAREKIKIITRFMAYLWSVLCGILWF
jgi:hypothetical protein